MMKALATVASVYREGQSYCVELSCEQQTSCNSCQSKSSCGTGIVSKALGNKQLSWQLKTEKAVQPGDVVEIGFPEKRLLQSAALVYLLPILFLFIGALFGQFVLNASLATGEPVTILSALLFAFCGVMLARYLVRPLERKTSQKVILLRVLGHAIA
jgi:sigma-E factor negative regulatory protein RseC